MYPLFFVVPIIGVLILSILIGVAVRSHTKSSVAGKQSKGKRLIKERQAMLQLLLIVFSFLLGYAPFLSRLPNCPNHHIGYDELQQMINVAF